MRAKTYTSLWQHKPVGQLIQSLRWLLRPFGGLENRFIAFVVKSHNGRVRRYLHNNHPEKVLLIMPRCVQKTGCRSQVQKSLDECLSCGRCPLGDVASVCDQHGLQALVAFRSQIAFDLAREQKPNLIVATACHDRLIKALRNVPEVPSLLTPLTGMDRMCINATVDTEWLDDQLTAISA